MPIHSAYPPITVPSVDLWTFLFERTDREYPDHHVVYVDVATQRRVTFRDIRETAERFGKGLRQHWRWQKGDVLALMTPNTVDVAAVACGTLFAGGVVCPFNNLYTVEELASQLKSSGAKALVTNVACLEVAREAALIVGMPLDRILLVGVADPKRQFRYFSSLQSTSDNIKKAAVNPKEDLAFLVYSSGTTGLPKGVMLTHENMVANTLQASVIDGDRTNWQRDRGLGFLPMYHIYGISALVFVPVYRGLAAYVMAGFDLEVFCKTIQQEKITFAFIVPPVALALAKHPLVDKYDLSSLRILTSGAAPTAKELVEAIYHRLKVPVRQVYGLSETSPAVSSQSWEEWDKPIGSSGRLVPSMSLKIMESGKEVRKGVEGELWVKGPNVFKGYYNNPKATAESLDAEGWYRTGDIGYVDDKDNIFITDRVKELIKYNGFQVAPAQLESLLLGHPAVNDVAVIGVYDQERVTELPRAYIVLAGGYKGDEKMEKELKGWLDAKVAPHKRLRGGIRFVDAIPKSNAGKLLRRVLVEQAKKEEAEKAPKARL
ncbi:AMP-dependent synthetase/ligase [Macrophomina phaseolina MS6]|uniref:AMP-dependent synthetase/ligase n=1 Tax=Macrophomina phaseolina (strain MS6) TaxID=1126212 RepID=K2QVR5_MACPH|nr:AMP-dependent synthetase/ligase [Macrophomina phaseolina MS6]